MKGNYIHSLNGIRAIAVIIVLLGHAGLGHIIPGGLGVTVFFFLSGYLITTLVKAEFDNTNTINLRNFYIRRFFRLTPPLLFCLLLVYSLTLLSVVQGGVSWSGLFYQIFYLANYQLIFGLGGEIPNGLGILWSLAVEEHFYFVYPFAILLLFKYLNKTSTTVALIILLFAVLLWRYYLFVVVGVNELRTYYATDTRIDSILYGCVFALLYSPETKPKRNSLNIKSIALLGCSCVLLLITLLYRSSEFRETLRYSIQGIALMPFFYYAIVCSNNNLFKWLEWNPLRKIGIYSYSIYLIHYVVVVTLEYYFPSINILVLALLTFGLSVMFAVVVDKYVDSYFHRIKNRFK